MMHSSRANCSREGVMQKPDNDIDAEPEAHPNQFALLGQRRFAPFFWTQFSGAANDNLFKFAFTVMRKELKLSMLASMRSNLRMWRTLYYT